MEKAKKFNNISLLRVIAILAIFSFHLLQPLSTTQGRQYFPMAFGVEIFLFISGFLYAFKEIAFYKEFFKKNFIKILWPTFLFILICLATGGVFSLLTKTDFVQFFHYTSVTGELLYNHGHLWYIVAILLCYLSLPILKNLGKKKIYYLFLSLFFVADIIAMTIFDIQIVYAPFFVGFMFCKFIRTEAYQGLKKWIFLVCPLVFAGTLVAYIFVFNSDTLIANVPHLRFLLKHELTGVIAVAFSILFFEAFNFTNKYEKLSQVLRYTDKYIFAFYFMHSFVILSATGLMMSISPYLAINIILIFNMSVISCVIFQQISDWTQKKIFRKREKVAK